MPSSVYQGAGSGIGLNVIIHAKFVFVNPFFEKNISFFQKAFFALFYAVFSLLLAFWIAFMYNGVIWI